jgi:hypothetical protein
MTVSWDRSADVARGGRPGASAGLAETGLVTWKLAPHRAQKFAPGGALLPHEGQLSTNAEPH